MYAVDYLFSKISLLKNKVFTIKISYLELYNEQVIDLLTIKPSNEGIMIVEDMEDKKIWIKKWWN